MTRVCHTADPSIHVLSDATDETCDGPAGPGRSKVQRSLARVKSARAHSDNDPNIPKKVQLGPCIRHSCFMLFHFVPIVHMHVQDFRRVNKTLFPLPMQKTITQQL